VQAGADIIAIPSTTTHAYYREIADSVAVPVLNMIELVADEIAHRQCQKAAIVATSPTAQYGLYNDAFNVRGIEAVYPDASTQEEIMTIIQGVKSKGAGHSWGQRLVETTQAPWAQAADLIVLACTETPVVYQQVRHVSLLAKPVLDATDVLAMAAIHACSGDEAS
jgi:aspartate racemase